MKWIIIDNLILIYETVLLAYMARHFLSARQKGVSRSLLYLVLLLAMHRVIAVFFSGRLGLTALYSGLADFFLFGILWPKQWRKRIFIIFFFYTLMISLDLFFIFSFPLTEGYNPEQYQLLCTAASRSLLLFLVLFAIKLGDKSGRTNLFLFVAPLPALISAALLFSIQGYEVYDVMFNQRISIVIIVILLTALVLLCAYAKLNHNEEALQAKLLAQEQLRQMQQKYYSSAMESYKAMRMARHDLKHFSDLVAAHIHAGQYDQALEICGHMVKGTGETFLFTGNETVDAILYSKQALFGKLGVTFSVEGSLPPELHYDGADICVILSNMLENAAESVSGLQENHRWISVRFRCQDWLLIVVENETANRPQKQGGRYLTGKTGAGHGIGLESIEAACKRQNGYMEIIVKEGKFITAVTLQPNVKRGESEDR